jgi:hypothetical protein
VIKKRGSGGGSRRLPSVKSDPHGFWANGTEEETHCSPSIATSWVTLVGGLVPPSGLSQSLLVVSMTESTW